MRRDSAASCLIALPHRLQLRGHRLFEDMNATLAAYIRAQLLACVLVGSFCGLGFAALGLPYSVLARRARRGAGVHPAGGPPAAGRDRGNSSRRSSRPDAGGLDGLRFSRVVRILEDYVVYPRLMRS